MNAARRLAWQGVLLMAGLVAVSSLVAGAEPSAIGEHDDNVYKLAYSPDGRRLASASGDHTAVLRDAADGRNPVKLRHDSPVYSVVYSPDGTLIATADGTGHVRLWSSTGEPVAAQQRHQDAVYALAFSPDGAQLAAAGGGGDGGDTRCLIFDVPGLTLRQQLSGHTRAVYGLAFLSNGEMLISSSSDRTLRLWSLVSETSDVFNDHTSDAYRCDVSPDGQWVISSGQDRRVRLKNLRQLKTLSLEPVSRDPVYGAVFTPDGRLIVAVGDDCRLHIWETAPGYSHLSDQKISRQALYAVAVSPDSKTAAVAGADHRIYLILLPVVTNQGQAVEGNSAGLQCGF